MSQTPYRERMARDEHAPTAPFGRLEGLDSGEVDVIRRQLKWLRDRSPWAARLVLRGLVAQLSAGDIGEELRDSLTWEQRRVVSKFINRRRNVIEELAESEGIPTTTGY